MVDPFGIVIYLLHLTMTINILEDITTDLAARVLTEVGANTDKAIDVNIMSRGGDMMAGNAIISALELAPAKVTTKVYGVAASMAAAISQAGDTRLISQDAIFQPHFGAGYPTGRPTKENLKKVADTLEVMDAIMIKSFNKSNLTPEGLSDLLSQDQPITAKAAKDMAFFDNMLEPIQAEAKLNSLLMSKETSLMDQLTALKEKFIPKAVDVDPAVVVDPAAPVVEESVSRAEFDKLLALVTQLMEKMSPIDAPSVEETVAAKVTEILDAKLELIASSEVIPAATNIVDPAQVTAPEFDAIQLRQKDIQSKFKK